jgi:Tfp pilus assembly protein PilF
MAKLLKKTAVVAAACLILAGLLSGQTGSLAGRVIGEDGKPLQGAEIQIVRKDIKGNYKTKSNKKGEWFHAGLPLGNYDLTCVVDGKPVDKANNVRTTLGDPKEIEFNLAQIKQKQAALQKAAESGKLSAEQSREMTAEQRAAFEKSAKERSAAMAKNKALNDAFNTAMTAMQAKDFQAAVDNFAKAAEIDPKQHVVWANMAESYVGLANTKTGAEQTAAQNKAIEAYQKALELKPEDAGMHNNFGLVLARMKKLPEAQAELEKAAALDAPGAGKYYYNMGAVLVNTGQSDAAIEAFKKAITVDPNYADAQYQYAIALSAKMTMTPDGKMVPPPGMVDALQAYLKLRPDGPFAEGAKGMLAGLDSAIETKYINPDAKKAPAKKKK